MRCQAQAMLLWAAAVWVVGVWVHKGMQQTASTLSMTDDSKYHSYFE